MKKVAYITRSWNEVGLNCHYRDLYDKRQVMYDVVEELLPGEDEAEDYWNNNFFNECDHHGDLKEIAFHYTSKQNEQDTKILKEIFKRLDIKYHERINGTIVFTRFNTSGEQYENSAVKISDKDNMNIEKHIGYFTKATKEGWCLNSHDFIYKVNQGFRSRKITSCYIKDNKVITTDLDNADKKLSEEVYIKKGSFIEFRYMTDFNFRTEDNVFCFVDPSVIAIKCTPFAKIKNDVARANKSSLKEILENKDYILCT